MIGIPLYYCFENIGLSYTSASSGSLIIATIPGLNLLAGRIIWKERYPAFQLLGVFLSIIGVFLIIFSQASTAGEDSILGNILILGSALSWVAFIRLNQPLTEKYASLTLIYWQSLIGGLSFALFSLIEGKWANFHVSNLNGEVILHLAILTLLCSGAAYLFYFFAQSELGPTVTTTYLNLIPVFGVLTGILVLGEELAFAQLIGGLIVIIGIYLVTKEHQNKVIRDASKTI